MTRRLNVLLDLSPIRSDLTSKTGLARVASSLAGVLHASPAINLSVTSWATVYSTLDFFFRCEESKAYKAINYKFSALEHLYYKYFVAGTLRQSAFSRISGHVVSRLRDPFGGYDPNQFDIIHSTYAPFPKMRHTDHPKKIITVHDMTALFCQDLFENKQIQAYRRLINRISKDQWVACVSESTASDFIRFTGHPKDHVCVIPNGVDSQKFYPETDKDKHSKIRDTFNLGRDPFLLTLSSLAPHKNLDLLFACWPHLQDRFPACRLVVAGGKSENTDLLRARYSRALNLTKNIVFTGHISDEQIRCLLSASNAFLFPSLYEGFGLPALEAMACGTPVIASSRTSLPEILGSAPSVIDPDDVASWISKMGDALSCGIRDRPSRVHLERARQFSWKASAEKYVALYNRVFCV